VPGGNGRTDVDVGGFTLATSTGGLIDVVYTSALQHLRHAFFDGSTWSFEEVPGFYDTRLLTRRDGALQMVAYDRNFQLTAHLWRTADGWHDEVLANQFGGTPCTTMGAGKSPSAILDDRGLDVYFKGNNFQLCRATNSSAERAFEGWQYTAVDGLSAPSVDGALAEVIPLGTSAVTYRGRRYVSYVDTDEPPHIGTHGLRVASLLQAPDALGRWCETFDLAKGNCG
jgi:hypothetical protein